MSDQLSLRLTGDVARLPRSIRPMLPKPVDAAFDSDEHMFEPRWGGRRAFAFIELDRSGRGPRVRLIDESGVDLSPHLPELAATLPDLVGDLPAVLDGEIVMPDRSGRMDEAALAARMADGAPGTTAVYLAFDLLWASGRPIIAQPLLRRRERMARIVRPGAELVILPGVVRDGIDLYFAVVQQGLRGVMARHLRSPYLPGRRSDLWRWIASQPGEMPLHAVPDPLSEPPSRPVLALIQRLPLED